MKKLLTLLAVLGFGLANLAHGQNRILDTGNQYFSITNFGPGPATLSNLTGLPLGTWPEAAGTGELALKVLVINPITSGSGASTGYQRTLTISTLTSSGSITAGSKSVSFLVVSGSLNLISTGTVTLSSGQSWNQSVAPDTFPAFTYTISSGGTVSEILSR